MTARAQTTPGRAKLALLAAAAGALASFSAPGAAQAERACAHTCSVRIVASPKASSWVSPHRLHGDLKVSVTVRGNSTSPIYYRRGAELCVGYFAGFGTATKIDVCGSPYHLRVTTQAFHGTKAVTIHYTTFAAG